MCLHVKYTQVAIQAEDLVDIFEDRQLVKEKRQEEKCIAIIRVCAISEIGEERIAQSVGNELGIFFYLERLKL